MIQCTIYVMEWKGILFQYYWIIFQEEVNECILKLRFCLNFKKIIELINFVLLAIFINSY